MIVRLSGPGPGSNRIPSRGLTKPAIRRIWLQDLPRRSQPSQVSVVRIIDIILLDPVPLIELELALHLVGAVARGADLEDDLGRDPALLPLLV